MDYGVLPGYEYVAPVNSPPQAQRRFVVLFDNDVEYFFNCQSTPDVREKLEKGCRTVLDSIKDV